MEGLLTPEELAAYLKVNRRTIYRMLEANELPFAFKIKGSWRFKQSDVSEWVEKQKLES
jgi:excisionase family DNA binding protein